MGQSPNNYLLEAYSMDYTRLSEHLGDAIAAVEKYSDLSKQALVVSEDLVTIIDNALWSVQESIEGIVQAQNISDLHRTDKDTPTKGGGRGFTSPNTSRNPLDNLKKDIEAAVADFLGPTKPK